MPEPRWPKFTWDERARQYRGEDGRFVSRVVVRQALDEVIDAQAAEMERDARLLQSGAITLIEWQLRMERGIKLIHTASAAIAAGGWAQATARDWANAAVKIRRQYHFLNLFARKIANGLPLDGRFLARAASYGSAGSGTYEAVLRRRDLASGDVVAEHRIVHSTRPCKPCARYEGMGWQKPGVLPDIGDQCDCKSHCRCTFQRRFRKARRRGASAA